MKTSIGEIYSCEYCGRKGVSKGGMKIHERSCGRNPVNDTICKTCEYCVRLEEYDCDGIDYMIKDFKCTKTGNFMHSPKVLRMKDPKRKEIIERCPVIMSTISTGCPFYKKIQLPF